MGHIYENWFQEDSNACSVFLLEQRKQSEDAEGWVLDNVELFFSRYNNFITVILKLSFS